jgi:hypothetical protein
MEKYFYPYIHVIHNTILKDNPTINIPKPIETPVKVTSENKNRCEF